MDIIDVTLLHDKRSDCYSVLSELSMKDYLLWYNEFGYKNSLEEQRDVVRSTTANKIRTRLIDDLTNGAVIPPIVLGLSVDEKCDVSRENIADLIRSHVNEATVIDGIQRTEAIKQAVEKNPDILESKIRTEFWVSFNPINLIYRMLILNTGQMPWSVKRQLDVVYKPFVKKLEANVEGIKTYTENDAGRRKRAGEYQVNSIIELFMAFTSRKEIVDTKDRLAEDFARLELIEATASEVDSDLFMRTIELMVKFDKSVSNYEGSGVEDLQQFKKGLDLFTKLPSQVGFVVAISKKVLGLAGSVPKSKVEKYEKLKEISNGLGRLLNNMASMNQDQLGDFLAFDVLNERYSSFSRIRIGEKQREFFKKAYTELIENKFDISLREAWIAGIS